MRRRAILCALALLAWTAPPAAAATVEAVEVPSPFTGEPDPLTLFSEVRLQGGAGIDDVVVDMQGGEVRLSDSALLATGTHCAPLGPTAAHCGVPVCPEQPCVRGGYLAAVVLDLGPGDDAVTPLRTGWALRVAGGDGADRIATGDGGPDLHDTVDAGAGDDMVVQGAGIVDVTCGPGRDTVVVREPGRAYVAADCETVLATTG